MVYTSSCHERFRTCEQSKYRWSNKNCEESVEKRNENKKEKKQNKKKENE